MLNINNSPVLTSANGTIKAFVISLKDNLLSQKLTNRCIESLKNVQMPYEVWYGLDGTNGKDIIIPDHLKNVNYLSWIKRANKVITTSEISLFLTHFSLWAHCCTLNEPIVILEHDAIMLKNYNIHKYMNAIYYLGTKVQLNLKEIHLGWYYIKDSYYYIPCTHAYAIDPSAARNLISHALKTGITGPIDNFMRMDVFTVVQDDLYAYEESEGSVIKHSINI